MMLNADAFIRNILPPTITRPATSSDVIKQFGIARLTDLTTAHMNPQAANNYNDMIGRVKKWKGETAVTPGLSFVLSSKQVGVGKTHIAKAVNASFCAIVGEKVYIDDVPQFTLEYAAKMYTARELIALLGGDNQMSVWDIVPKHVKCLVIDDLGREGYLDYVQAAKQQEEKQSRYFHLINHIYETRRNGRYPVNLFITTNLTPKEIEELVGPACWSRLMELCPRGYIVELTGIDDYRRVKSGRA